MIHSSLQKHTDSFWIQRGKQFIVSAQLCLKATKGVSWCPKCKDNLKLRWHLMTNDRAGWTKRHGTLCVSFHAHTGEDVPVREKRLLHLCEGGSFNDCSLVKRGASR
jgi:hypothetical protein